MQDYRSLAADLVSALKKQGADACDAYLTASSGFKTTIRLTQIEKLQQSESKGLGLRVFKDGAAALTFTTDFREKAIENLVRETMEIVKISGSDEFNGLAPNENLGEFATDLMIFDQTLSQLSPEKKIEMAREAEQAGRDFDKRITNSNGATWSDSVSQITLANSEGFVGQYQTTNASLSVGLLAEENEVKQTDYWFSSDHFLKKIEAAQTIGKEAARRAISKLGARKIKSQVVPVVIDAEVAGDFVRMIFNAASGINIYRRTSYLVDKLGAQIASPLVTIIDDATISGGLASRPFDAEGVKSSPFTVVDKGILQNYVCDSYSARRLNLTPTGNASRNYQSTISVEATNLYLQKGTEEPEKIVKSMRHGLFLNKFFGFGVNGVTGDFSQGAAGFWIENGEIAFPVQEITLAGNVLSVLKNVELVGNDLSFRFGNIASPTLFISEITVGGE